MRLFHGYFSFHTNYDSTTAQYYLSAIGLILFWLFLGVWRKPYKISAEQLLCKLRRIRDISQLRNTGTNHLTATFYYFFTLSYQFFPLESKYIPCSKQEHVFLLFFFLYIVAAFYFNLVYPPSFLLNFLLLSPLKKLPSHQRLMATCTHLLCQSPSPFSAFPISGPFYSVNLCVYSED